MDKSKLSETDICEKFISPALTAAGWDVHEQILREYKNEGIYAEWLRQRLEVAPVVDRVLFVWTAEEPVSGNTSGGPVCLVYSENSAWLDGGSLSRYWLLSDQWPIDHGSCVVSMLKVVGITRSLGILVVGRLVPASVLRKLESGRIFAPQAQTRIGKLWYPEDMASAVAEPMSTPGI